MKKRINCILTAVLLCFAFVCSVAYAAAMGSLNIRVEDKEDKPVDGFVLHIATVMDTEGTVTDIFAGAGLSVEELMNTGENAANARTLCDYADKMGIDGIEKMTDETGVVLCQDLTEGVYLVWADEDNKLTFEPFLVYIPTEINGQELWELISVPKAGEKPQPIPTPPPTPVPTPTPTPDQQLPQTGFNMLPVHLLIALGIVFTVIGVVLIIRGKSREEDE